MTDGPGDGGGCALPCAIASFCGLALCILMLIWISSAPLDAAGGGRSAGIMINTTFTLVLVPAAIVLLVSGLVALGTLGGGQSPATSRAPETTMVRWQDLKGAAASVSWVLPPYVDGGLWEVADASQEGLEVGTLVAIDFGAGEFPPRIYPVMRLERTGNSVAPGPRSWEIQIPDASYTRGPDGTMLLLSGDRIAARLMLVARGTWNGPEAESEPGPLR